MLDMLQEARELHERMSRASKGTILRDELRIRRNKRLIALHVDDPERWTAMRLAREIGSTQPTVWAVIRSK